MRRDFLGLSSPIKRTKKSCAPPLLLLVLSRFSRPPANFCPLLCFRQIYFLSFLRTATSHSDKTDVANHDFSTCYLKRRDAIVKMFMTPTQMLISASYWDTRHRHCIHHRHRHLLNIINAMCVAPTRVTR